MMKVLESARGERSIEGFKGAGKILKQRVKKQSLYCPSCGHFWLKTSDTNAELRCPVCKKRFAVVLNGQHFMITSDRRECTK